MAKGTHKKNALTWVVIAALALGFLGGYLVARAKYTNQIGLVSKMVMDRSTLIDRLNNKLNRVSMTEDGKMVQVKNGLISPLRQSITFSNGVTVLTNGKVVQKDGTTTTLKPGESIDMDGNIISDDEMMDDN